MWINYIKDNEVKNLPDYRHFVNLDNVETILMTEDLIEMRFVSGASTRVNKGERSFDVLGCFLRRQLREIK